MTKPNQTPNGDGTAGGPGDGDGDDGSDSGSPGTGRLTGAPLGTRSSRAPWIVLAAICGLGVGIVGAVAVLRQSNTAPAAAPHQIAAPVRKAVYRCPMHPAITADRPGQCPICGMNLVLDANVSGGSPAGASDAAASAGTASSSAPASRASGNVPGLATVAIDPERQQLIGLRTAPATRTTVTTALRTVGRVEIDPTRVRRVNVKVESFVDRVFVDFVGKPVRKGQPLMTVYSPSLLAAQEEYLLALRTQRQLGDGGLFGTSGDDLVAASRRKLELWDVPADAIDRLQKTGVAQKTLTLVSPIAGVVTAKNVVEGAALRLGDTPYEITDLGMVWVMADAYESDVSTIRVGMKATLAVPAYPHRLFAGLVQFIDPIMDPASRTAKVHIHVNNRSGELKPEMFGDVMFQGRPRTAVRVPGDAIIRAGDRDVVFLSLGAGKFSPRVVQVGARDGEFVEVLSGVDEGQEVVTRANFLVDSESRLRASLAAMVQK